MVIMVGSGWLVDGMMIKKKNDEDLNLRMLLNLPSLILKLDQSLAVFEPQKQKFLVTSLDMCCCFMANLHTVVLKFAPAKKQTNKAKTLPHVLGDNKFPQIATSSNKTASRQTDAVNLQGQSPHLDTKD